MSAFDGTRRAEHPDQLLWYLSGKLDSDERRRIESHLLVCAECRALARRLAPLKTGRAMPQAPALHPEPEELDAYRLAAPDARSVERARIEAHLSGCAGCREDLAALREMDVGVARARRPGRWWLLAACLTLVLAAPLTWVWLAGRGAAITLMPSLRSAATASVLSGHGPWRVNLVPPSEVGSGVYEMRVERADGSVVTSMNPRTLAVGQEVMEIEIPALTEPGPYRIALRPTGQNNASPYLYSFRVTSGSGD